MDERAQRSVVSLTIEGLGTYEVGECNLDRMMMRYLPNSLADLLSIIRGRVIERNEAPYFPLNYITTITSALFVLAELDGFRE